jgi:hypothetical protein
MSFLIVVVIRLEAEKRELAIECEQQRKTLEEFREWSDAVQLRFAALNSDYQSDVASVGSHQQPPRLPPPPALPSQLSSPAPAVGGANPEVRYTDVSLTEAKAAGGRGWLRKYVVPPGVKRPRALSLVK